MNPHYPYHFLQVFFNELLGSYAHLQQFVERTRFESGNKSPKLLEAYSKQLAERINEILTNADDLATTHPDLINPVHLIDVFNGLRKQSDKFQQLHRTLRWFSAPWPEAEVFEFLSRAFDERGLGSAFEDLNPSIVFSDEYNFLTYDVGYLKSGVGRSGLTAWALPKSESTNPLLWSVLVHEVAHSYFKEDKIFNYISRSFAVSRSSEAELIRRWAVELNADLFGFQLMGPAYLYSLMYFSMFFVSGNLRTPLPERKDSRSFHPPPATRVRLLLEETRRTNTHKGLFRTQLEKSLNVFESLFNERLAFDVPNGFEAKDIEHDVLSPETETRLWNTLKSFQQELSVTPIVFDKQFDAVTELSTKLDDKMLAGSIAARFNRELIDGFLEKQPNITREGALSLLNETPARMVDIMNAGWMNKLKGDLWKVPVFKNIEMVADNRAKYLPDMLDDLTEPARQLQTSIQVALVLSPLI